MHQAVSRMGTEDERPMLKKMRRGELFYYAQAKKVEVHPDDPASDMRRKLIENGFDGTDAVETIRNLMAVQEARKQIESEQESAKSSAPNVDLPDGAKLLGITQLVKKDGAETTLAATDKGVYELEGEEWHRLDPISPAASLTPAEEPKLDIDTLTMPQLRKAIKAAGLKQSPKDTADILRARLRGQNTS